MRIKAILTLALVPLALALRAAETDSLAGGEASPFRFKNLSVYGSVEVLTEQAQNEEDLDHSANDERGNTLTRTRLGLNAAFTDLVRGRVEFVRAPQVGPTVFPPTQYGGNVPTNINNELGNFHVQNAFIEIDRILGFDRLRVGRQYVGRRGDFIAYYGPIDDNRMIVRSLQGAHATKTFAGMRLDLVATKVNEEDAIPQPGISGPTDSDDGIYDGDIQMAYAHLNTDRLLMRDDGGWEFEAGLYEAVDKNSSSHDDSNTLQIYDLRAKYVRAVRERDRLTLSAEVTMNGGADKGPQFDIFNTLVSSGSINRYQGNAYILKAAYDWRSRLAVSGLLAVASGDRFLNDTRISAYRDFTSLGFPGSDFRHGHIYHGSAILGFSAGFDTRDLGDLGLRLAGGALRWTPARFDDRLLGTFEYWSAETDVLRAGSDKLIMREIDWTLRYAHSPEVAIWLVYGILRPGEQLKILRGAALSDAIQLISMKLDFRFGMPPRGAPAF